jgi:hypothetical protein
MEGAVFNQSYVKNYTTNNHCEVIWILEPAYRVGVRHPHVHRQYGVGPRGVSIHSCGRGYPEQ